MASARAPVDVGDILKLKIEALGPHGMGVAKLDDFVILVEGGKPGREYKARITKVGNTYAEATALQ